MAALVILISKNTTRTLHMKYILPPVCIPTWDICFPASLPSRYSCCSWFFCALGQKFVRVKNKGNFCINSWLIYVSLFLRYQKLTTMCTLKKNTGRAFILYWVIHAVQIWTWTRLPFTTKNIFTLLLLSITATKII